MASYWEVEGDKVRCLLCPHRCLLDDGKCGLCHSRVNVGGQLVAGSYDSPCAIAVDPIEKKPLFHFLPGSRALSVASAGCNFRCLNCQNAEISQVSPWETASQVATPEQLVNSAQRSRIPVIAYTYTEPLTFYEYMFDTATLARSCGIRNTMVSAGYVLPVPLQRLCGVLDAANIDLKCFDDKLYRHQCNGTLSPVLRTIEILCDAGVWLEITNLLIPSFNDGKAMISQMCHWLAENGFADVPFHFSRFFPRYRCGNIQQTPLNTLLLAKQTALDAGLHFVYVGNVGEYEGENTYCPACGSLLVRRDGFRIVHNSLQDGCCPSCGATIPGVWN